jgi:hypothetical protein
MMEGQHLGGCFDGDGATRRAIGSGGRLVQVLRRLFDEI